MPTTKATFPLDGLWITPAGAATAALHGMPPPHLKSCRKWIATQSRCISTPKATISQPSRRPPKRDNPSPQWASTGTHPASRRSAHQPFGTNESCNPSSTHGVNPCQKQKHDPCQSVTNRLGFARSDHPNIARFYCPADPADNPQRNASHSLPKTRAHPHRIPPRSTSPYADHAPAYHQNKPAHRSALNSLFAPAPKSINLAPTAKADG